MDISIVEPLGASEGVTQGSLISPVLANIYLHELDVFVTIIPMPT